MKDKVQHHNDGPDIKGVPQYEDNMRALINGEDVQRPAFNPAANAAKLESDLLDAYNIDHPDAKKTKLTDEEMKAYSQKLLDDVPGNTPNLVSPWDAIQTLRREDELMLKFWQEYPAQHNGRNITDEPGKAQTEILDAERKKIEAQAIEEVKEHRQQPNAVPEASQPQPAPAEKPQPQDAHPPEKHSQNTQAPADKMQAAIAHARDLFRQHSQDGAQHVDPSAPGYAPPPVAVAQNQTAQRSSPS